MVGTVLKSLGLDGRVNHIQSRRINRYRVNRYKILNRYAFLVIFGYFPKNNLCL